jgi:serine/threonine protein kinase
MSVTSDTARVFSPGEEPFQSAIQECAHCHTRIDVSRFEPLQQIACPGCGREMAVQGSIDRFKLQSIAGQGGVGIVYQAYDPHLGRKIALKVVRQDKANEEAFQQLAVEAGVTANINHPHVVRVYSVGSVRGRVFIAMEIIAGGSLDDLLLKRGRLSEAEVLDIGIQVAQGLHAAQRAGLVHRDIKPGNILFANPQTAKVVDFGLAVFEQNAVASSEIWGTPYYMPPERLQGIAEDFRADIYSLGATLFHVISGRPPFEAPDSTAVVMKRLHAPAPSVLTYAPGVSNATAFVLKKMLEREADARFQSYEELIDSLQFARNDLGNKTTAKARVVLNSQQESNSGMWVTLTSIAVLVVGCVAGFFMMRSSAKPASKPVVDAPVAEEPIDVPKPETVKPAVAKVEIPKPAKPPVAPPKSPNPEVVKSGTEKLKAVPSETPKLLKSLTFGTAHVPTQGVYQLVNRSSNLALEASNTTMGNGGQIGLAPVSKAYHQRWIVRNVVNGTSRLLTFHLCKALDVRGASREDTAALSTYTSNGTFAQRWQIRQLEPGWFAIVAECSGKALSMVPEPSGAAKIGQREYTGKPEQQWRLESLGALPEGIDAMDPALTPELPVAPAVTVRAATAVGANYRPLDIASVATGDSRTGLYSDPNDKDGVLQPQLRGTVEVAGVPFSILDPSQTPTGKDNITLRGGRGQSKRIYPTKVEIPAGGISLARLHVIGGVAAFGYPWSPSEGPLGAIAAKITIQHQGGGTQEIILRNGHEIMDHQAPLVGNMGVPGSALIEGFAKTGRQLRYFSKPIAAGEPVEKIVIESLDNIFAPTFFALTAEKR